jgi:chromosomal replication initiation ATPase DnaA
MRCDYHYKTKISMVYEILSACRRILGNSNFVRIALAEAQESLGRQYALAANGGGFDQCLAVAADLTGFEPADIVGPSKVRTIAEARILVSYWAALELGLSITSITSILHTSVSTVSEAVKKGRKKVGQSPHPQHPSQRVPPSIPHSHR